jgi:heptosyltransferase-1
MRVLIIKLSAFGDIIHSLSVLDCFREYAKRYNREVELHWLVEKKWGPILEDCPGIHNLILTDTKTWRKDIFSMSTWKEIFGFWSNLRRVRYDLVIDINGLLRSAILGRLARADQRVGFSKDSDFCREKHSVGLLDKTFSVPPGHVVDQTVGLLEKVLGIEMPGAVIPSLPLKEDVMREAEILLDDNGLGPKDFAVIAAGGGWETKLLNEKSIAAFCDCISEYGIKPVLSWAGNNEKERSKKISALAQCDTMEIGDIPVDIFIELLRMARIVIGPDTGTVHAASAVETPTVSYYGPSSGQYSGPRRLTDRVVQISPECGPCFRRRCEKGLCKDLNIDKVLEAISEQLAE